MGTVYFIDQVDHEVMYQAERASYVIPEVRDRWTWEFFLKDRSGLPSIGLALDGKCIGGAYMDHGFIHVSVLPEYHGKWAMAYAKGIEWAFSHADPIYAGILETNEKCLRFVEQSGWEKVGRFNRMVYFRSTKRLYERLKARRKFMQVELA